MSKYASLPDIDTAPDVYETPDVPAVHISERDDDSDNDGPNANSGTQKGSTNLEINQTHLDQTSARQKFDSALPLDSSDADFSSSLLRGQPRRSSARYPLPAQRPSFETSEYSILPRGYGVANGQVEKETTLERFRRLRIEVNELEEELGEQERNQIGQDEPVEVDSEQASKAVSKKGKTKAGPSSADLLIELQRIRAQLGNLSASITPSNDSTASTLTDLRQREAYAKSLLQQLTDGRNLSAQPEAGQSQSISKPSPSPATSTTAAKLDARLNVIENLLGSTSLLQSSSSGDISLPPPLLVTISKLEHQLSLLTQPRHLDSISRRVKVIVTDLERVHEARRKLSDHRPLSIALASGITVVTQNQINSTQFPNSDSTVSTSLSGVPGVIGSSDQPTLPPDALHKLERLYNLLPRIDPLLPLVPHLLSRLRSLAQLHSESSEFGERLNRSTNSLSELVRRSNQLQKMMEKLEGNFENNEKLVQNNLKLVEDRMEKVLELVDQLKKSDQ